MRRLLFLLMLMPIIASAQYTFTPIYSRGSGGGGGETPPAMAKVNQYTAVADGQDYINLVFTLPTTQGYRAASLHFGASSWGDAWTVDSVYCCNNSVAGTPVVNLQSAFKQYAGIWSWNNANLPTSGSVTFRVKTSMSLVDLGVCVIIYEGVDQTTFYNDSDSDDGCGSADFYLTGLSSTIGWEGNATNDCYCYVGASVKPATGSTILLVDCIQFGSNKNPASPTSGQTQLMNATSSYNFYMGVSSK